jgi:SAM-dependent methyltransferase
MSTAALAEHAQAVVGVDVSLPMLASAQAAPGVSYSRAGAEQLPFPDATFDAVTVCSGIHWFDQSSFFAEAARVLRRDGWVGLYDHYFLGEMVGVQEFSEWVGELMQRYPLPPRNRQVGDPSAETPSGYVVVGENSFVDEIEMTAEEFVDFQVTISNLVNAVEQGASREELRQWLLASTASMFDGAETRTLRFLGSVTCLRPE